MVVVGLQRLDFRGHNSVQAEKGVSPLLADGINFKYKKTNGLDLEFTEKEAQGLLLSN